MVLVLVVCFHVLLDVMGSGYLCGAKFAVKNIQIIILYIVYMCNRKKLIYGKEATESVFHVPVINQICLFDANVVVGNFIIRIEQKFCTKSGKVIVMSKSEGGVRTVKNGQ